MTSRPRRSAGAVLRLVRAAVSARLDRHDLVLLTAALTFYAAIAVLPLLLIALAAAAALVGVQPVQFLGTALAGYAPEELGFATNLEQLVRTGTEAGWTTIAAALVPATTYGEGLVRSFSRLADASSGRKGLRGRVLAVALLAALPLLVLIGLGAVAVLPEVLGGGMGPPVLGAYLSFLVTWGTATLLLAVTYRTFSPVPLRRSALWWSAGATGSFLAGMSLGWVVVLRYGVTVGRAYGGDQLIGSIVLFVVYLFLVQLTCLSGYVLALGLTDVGTEDARAAPRTTSGGSSAVPL